MRTEVFLIFIIGCAVGFRVLIEVFCNHAERKLRMMCVCGMMVLYTGIMILAINWLGTLSLIDNMALPEYSKMICVLILIMNCAFAFIIIVYYSVAQKRSLSGREKIKLKDM